MKNLTNKGILALFILGMSIFPFLSYAQVLNINTVYSTTRATEATVFGAVNPNGITTTAWFEYSREFNFIEKQETEHTFVGSQDRYQSIKGLMTNLRPGVIYYVRIVADNTNGTVYGNTILVNTNPVSEIQNTNLSILENRNTQTVDNSNIVIVQNTTSNNNSVSKNNTSTQKEIIINTNPTINTTTNINQNTVNEEFQKLEAKANTNLTANVLNTNQNFLPNNIFYWLLIILIVSAIIIVLRRIFI